MSVEFFVGGWLEERLGLYAASHMVILPLIALVATACDWAPAEGAPSTTLGWFFGASYANGLVLEVGRKIRAPDGEEAGVETYSKRWGCRWAVAAWGGAIAGAAALSIVAASRVGAGDWAVAVLVLTAGVAGAFAVRFLRDPTADRADLIELWSGVWLLASFASMGLLPLLV
jgi:4-hydroxybenzoate polyprenyltransferase